MLARERQLRNSGNTDLGMQTLECLKHRFWNIRNTDSGSPEMLSLEPHIENTDLGMLVCNIN